MGLGPGLSFCDMKSSDREAWVVWDILVLVAKFPVSTITNGHHMPLLPACVVREAVWAILVNDEQMPIICR